MLVARSSMKTSLPFRSHEEDKAYFAKPVYLGMNILDLSKSLTYDLSYNYIKTKYGVKYGDNAEILFTDTDSLAYQIKTKDLHNDINPDIENRFDTSDYPTNHPSGIKTGLNSKVLECLRMKLLGTRLLNLLV